MRALTIEELELVAGGFDTGGIYVTTNVSDPGTPVTDPSGGIGGDGNGGSGGSGGVGGGGGGTGGGGGNSGAPTADQAIAWANAKLGIDIGPLASHSPAFLNMLEDAMAHGWDIKYNPNAGSLTQYADANHAATILIQGNAQGNVEATIQQLAHELYHAYNPNPLHPESLSQNDYVNGMMREEGTATFVEAKVRQEILDATGTDIRIPGTASAQYMAEWNAYLADPAHNTVYATTDAMAHTYATSEHIYDGRTYQQYYTDEWNSRHH